MQVRKQQLEMDMEKQTGSKSGKEYVKPVYSHPAYLTYMPSTSLMDAKGEGGGMNCKIEIDIHTL